MAAITTGLLNRILKHLCDSEGYGCPIDEDCNEWLFFDYFPNIVKVTYQCYEDAIWKDKKSVKIALTGNLRDDICLGIKKVMDI